MELPDLNKAFEKAQRDLGKVNVLIAGRTGVGKSTLINSVFQGRLAATGQGQPVTQTTRLISKEGIPLAIWDTRGLEMSDFQETIGELRRLICERASEPDPQNHIHVAWLCIHEDGRRVQAAETTLCRELARSMPVLGVITKARNDDGFRAKAQQLLPEARNVVRVRARAEVLDTGHELPPMGLIDLIELTANALPEGQRRAFAAAQMASVRHKTQHAHQIVAAAAVTAAAAGATPIPFADAAILVPMQVSMLAGISALFGLDVSKAFLSVLAGTVGAGGGALAGRAIVAGLLKFIPGPGSLVGGVVAALTAGALTIMLGEIYIASLVAAFAETGGATPEIDAVKQEFMKRVRTVTTEDRSAFEKAKLKASKLLGVST